MATPPAAPTEDPDLADERLIQQFLGQGIDGEEELDLNAIGDATGKVDDAVDYEDISDDDLPSEEDVPSSKPTSGDADDDEDLLAGLASEAEPEPDFDDLFGDDLMSDPAAPLGDTDLGDLSAYSLPDHGDTLLSDASHGTSADDLFGSIDFGDSSMIAPQPQNPEDLARQYYPDFTPHSILSFSSLFNTKIGKLQTGPQKVPKVCVPTKVHVEWAPDENSLFNKATSAAHKVTTASRSRGIVSISPPVEEDDDEDEEMEDSTGAKDPIFERDLEIACDDWDSKLEAAMVTPPPSPPGRNPRDDDDDVIELGRPVKV